MKIHNLIGIFWDMEYRKRMTNNEIEINKRQKDNDENDRRELVPDKARKGQGASKPC